jgi:hypothetical protein
MEQRPGDKPSVRAQAIAALLAAGAGVGMGWIVLLTTGNVAVAIGIAGPMAWLSHNYFRKVIE